MKFTVNAKAFLAYIDPAIDVATKGTIKDFSSANKISISSNTDGLLVNAFGGKLSTSLNTSSDISYKHEADGQAVVDCSQLLSAVQSFGDKDVVVELCDSAVKISNGKNSQTVQTFTDSIDIIDHYLIAKSSWTIDRKLFLHAFGKVAFSMGEMKEKERFYTLCLKKTDNSIRFIAGSGARFTVLDIADSTLVDHEGEKEILIPKEQMIALASIIKNSDCSTIVIKQLLDDNENSQIVFMIDKNSYVISSVDNSLKYIDEEKRISKDTKMAFSTKRADWEGAIKGMNATFTSEYKKSNDVFVVMLDADTEDKVVKLSTDTPLKSERYIDIIDVSANDITSCELMCVAPFISEILKYATDNDYVTFYINSETEPVLLTVNDRINEITKTTESFYVFFVLISK